MIHLELIRDAHEMYILKGFFLIDENQSQEKAEINEAIIAAHLGYTELVKEVA